MQKNKIIMNVSEPVNDKDAVNKIYSDSRGIWLTIKEGFHTYKPRQPTEVKFDMMSSKLLDQNLRLSTDLYMKITIYFFRNENHFGHSHFENIKTEVELKINDYIALFDLLNIKDSLTCSLQGKGNDILKLSIVPDISNNKLKPYMHIEKINFLL